jgi:hypothetical protein
MICCFGTYLSLFPAGGPARFPLPSGAGRRSWRWTLKNGRDVNAGYWTKWRFERWPLTDGRSQRWTVKWWRYQHWILNKSGDLRAGHWCIRDLNAGQWNGGDINSGYWTQVEIWVLVIDVIEISTLEYEMVEISTLNTDLKWRSKRWPLIFCRSHARQWKCRVSTLDTEQSGDLSHVLAINVLEISMLDTETVEISTLDTEKKWRFKRWPLIYGRSERWALKR